MTAIIISEKSKAAQAIADALGKKQTIKENGVNVYKISNLDLYVIPLRGHIMQYENTPAFKKWLKSTNREIITNPNAISKIPSPGSKKYITVLKKYAKLSNLCINACDADVEGCNIGLIDAMTFVRQANRNIQVGQMWLNTLQKQDIINAFSNQIPPKWSWAYAGESRAIIDAIIGFSATREVTITLKPILQKLNTQFASIGRVQTSLLYLLYLKERSIREFIPDKYWSIFGDFFAPTKRTEKESRNKNSFRLQHVSNPFKDEKVAENIMNKIKGEREGIVKNVKSRNEKIRPPTPLNTSKALMLLTKNLKINASTALATLEALYLNKIISYPRTDSDKYPDDFNHIQYLQKLIVTNTYSKYVQGLFQKRRVDPNNGKNWAGDHPPITPIMGLDPNSTLFENELQKKVYDLVVRNYLASFEEDAELKKTQLLVDVLGEQFKGTNVILLKKGFLEIAPFLTPKLDVDIGILTPNQKLEIKKISKESKETQPPPRYTDTSLLKLMEKEHLGTKSTRPAHIETLLKRGYAKRVQRQFYVTELGYILIQSLLSIWKPFLEPNFTRHVEEILADVQDGKREMNDAVNQIKQEFLDLFDKFRANSITIQNQMNQVLKTGNVIRGKGNKIISHNSNPVTKTGRIRGTKQDRYAGNVKQGGASTNSKSGSNISYLPPPDGAAAPSNISGVKNGIVRTNNLIPKDVSEKDSLTSENCPVCNLLPMRLIITKDRKKYLKCTNKNCNTFYPLPKQGYPRLLKGKCKICGFNIVKISQKNKNTGKSHQYYLCPKCWKEGLEKQNKFGLCFACKDYKVENGRCKKK